jgi:serine/alanine adding enzyme
VSLVVERWTGSDADWDAFVRAQRTWTHFHLAGWRRVLGRAFGHECPYLVAREPQGRIVGVLPLVRVRSVVFGHYLVSMPFLNYGGPLGTPEACDALAGAARELAVRDGVRLLELRSREPLEAVTLPVSHRKITCVLDLPATGGSEGLWKSLDAKLRSQVRKPQKAGVTVRFGADQVDAFYGVFAHHMRDLGTPVLPRVFFRAIAAEFGDDAWFGVAYLGETPVACGCGFRWRDEFEITWASALLEHRAIAPNMLLYWEFLARATNEGLALFNFGRCTPDSGTHRFKRQWGARDETLWWYQHAASPTAGTPSPDDSAFAWGPRLWKKLPVPVASALGPWIVRYIP